MAKGSLPTERFSGLENLYDRYRPSYPAEAVDFIIQRCRLNSTTTLVDVGCGTGISTRLFAARGIPVIGIEPNDAMRSKAEAAPGDPRPAYRKGTGEATGLANGSAAAVLAAQAFHWFDADKALREFHRVLKPGGHAVLMWNERDNSDPFSAAYGAVVGVTPEAIRIEAPRSRAGEPILHSSLFTDTSLTTYNYDQELDEEGLIGRAFSASYAPRETQAVAEFTAALRRLFAEHQAGGKVMLRYITSVYIGKRSESIRP
jgi:SAM-dependent methyltransferase